MWATRTDLDLIYLDASGSTKAVAVHFPVSTTYAEGDAAATALASLIASVTGCVLVRRRIKYTVVRDDFPPAAIGSSVTRRAVLFLGCGPLNALAVIEILSPLDSLFLTEGPSAGYEIDVTNTDLEAFVAGLVANDATNPFADAIIDIQSGYLQSRV